MNETIRSLQYWGEPIGHIHRKGWKPGTAPQRRLKRSEILTEKLHTTRLPENTGGLQKKQGTFSGREEGFTEMARDKTFLYIICTVYNM